jgi:hypothetical protein
VNSSHRLIVAGTTYDKMVALRYFSGNLDSGFSSDGVDIQNGSAGFSAGADEARAVALDSSGNLIVVGTSPSTGINRDLGVWRYTSAGLLDSSFSGDGFAT